MKEFVRQALWVLWNVTIAITAIGLTYLFIYWTFVWLIFRF